VPTPNLWELFTYHLHLLQSSQQNPRWLNSSTPKPLLIIKLFQESEIQATILCSKSTTYKSESKVEAMIMKDYPTSAKPHLS
ncbi:tetrahydrocannabinolic acid synthase, partial [Quercus suber]